MNNNNANVYAYKRGRGASVVVGGAQKWAVEGMPEGGEQRRGVVVSDEREGRRDAQQQQRLRLRVQ
jgi:hypothetical protein